MGPFKLCETFDAQAYLICPSHTTALCAPTSAPSGGLITTFLPPASDAVYLTAQDFHDFHLSGHRPPYRRDVALPLVLISDRTRSKQAVCATSPGMDLSLPAPPPTTPTAPQRSNTQSTRGPTTRRRSSSIPLFRRSHRRSPPLPTPIPRTHHHPNPAAPDPRLILIWNLNQTLQFPLVPPPTA